jgi:hypothetical protein
MYSGRLLRYAPFMTKQGEKQEKKNSCIDGEEWNASQHTL